MNKKYKCLSDWYVDGVLVCKSGCEYEIADAPGEDNAGYCDIFGCENGKTLQTSWIEAGDYFPV